MSELNLAFAVTLVDALAESGLRHACISPGSRSGPLALAFARHPAVRAWVHVDERSSAFFALGMAKQLQEPVAVLTTSGTAAAELHPAVLEAHHSRTALLVLTADRPAEAHDRGANQTVDQARLYGRATRWSFDPGPPATFTPRAWRALAARALATARGPVPGPVHLNLPFREPLLPPPGAAGPPPGRSAVPTVLTADRRPAPDLTELSVALARAERPFLHAGGMPHDPRIVDALAALCARTQLVVHAEPPSHCRSPAVGGLVTHAEALLRDGDFARAHRPDLVIRLGTTPTSRTVNEWLLASEPAGLVLIDPDGAWADPDSLATHVVQADVALALSALATDAAPVPDGRWRLAWQAADSAAHSAVATTLTDAPLFEAHAVRELAAQASQDATVVVGSSMAIRDLDWFWPPDETRRFIANRGASGIDGFVSTALGVAAVTERPVVALCGDLSLYHDMNGLLAARNHGLAVCFVVLDNDGGGIFSFLPEAAEHDVFEAVFSTPTGLDFERVAALYDCGYARAGSVASLDEQLRLHLASPATTIIDVAFTRESSVSGHRAVWAAVSAAMRAARPAGRET